MKNHKINHFITQMLLIVFGVFLQDIITAQQLTLSSCVKQAIDNHPDIKGAQLDLSVSMTKVDQAKSNFYPELGASLYQSGNFGRSIDRFTNAYIDQFYNSTYAGVRLNMPIFNSFRNSNLLASAKTSKTASEIAIEKNKNILTAAVINAYINALSHAENIRNASNQLQNDSIQYQRLTQRREIGLTTKTEDLQLQNQLKTDELALMDARLNYEIALIDLAQLMNVTISPTTQLLPLNPDPLFSFENNTNILESLPQIAEFKTRMQSMEQTIKATKALSYPSLVLNADYGTFYASSNPDRTFSEQLNDTRNGSIAIGINVPFLGRWQTRPQVQELKINQLALQNSIDKTQLLLRQEIESANVRYKTFKKRYENAAFLLELAKENVALISEQLDAGTVTMVDFLLAQNNMDRAAASLTSSKYQLILQEKILKFYSVGTYDLD